MIFLIATVCASALMDDCQAYNLGQFDTRWQCAEVEEVYAVTLSRGPEQNYRLICEPDGEA